MYVFSAQTQGGPGARDLSRRNAATADPPWRISRPLRYPTFPRTEVRAPFARAATTLNRYSTWGEGRKGEDQGEGERLGRTRSGPFDWQDKAGRNDTIFEFKICAHSVTRKTSCQVTLLNCARR